MKKNYKNEYIKRKIEGIKQKTKPVDAMPLIKFMMEKGKKLTDKQRDTFINILSKGFNETGRMLVDRALTEEIFTEKEYLQIRKKCKIEDSDFGTILQAYFSKKDEKINDDLIVVTTDETNIFKNRKFLEKRFDIKIRTAKECLDLMKKQKGDGGD